MLNAAQVQRLARTGRSAVDYVEPLPRAPKVNRSEPSWDDMTNSERCYCVANRSNASVRPCIENGTYDFDDGNAGDYCDECDWYDRENHECCY